MNVEEAKPARRAKRIKYRHRLFDAMSFSSWTSSRAFWNNSVKTGFVVHRLGGSLKIARERERERDGEVVAENYGRLCSVATSTDGPSICSPIIFSEPTHSQSTLKKLGLCLSTHLCYSQIAVIFSIPNHPSHHLQSRLQPSSIPSP